jgi:hypothetical protein
MRLATFVRRLRAWLRAERDEYRFWAAMMHDLAEADALRAEGLRRDAAREKAEAELQGAPPRYNSAGDNCS